MNYHCHKCGRDIECNDQHCPAWHICAACQASERLAELTSVEAELTSVEELLRIRNYTVDAIKIARINLFKRWEAVGFMNRWKLDQPSSSDSLRKQILDAKWYKGEQR